MSKMLRPLHKDRIPRSTGCGTTLAPRDDGESSNHGRSHISRRACSLTARRPARHIRRTSVGAVIDDAGTGCCAACPERQQTREPCRSRDRWLAARAISFQERFVSRGQSGVNQSLGDPPHILAPRLPDAAQASPNFPRRGVSPSLPGDRTTRRRPDPRDPHRQFARRTFSSGAPSSFDDEKQAPYPAR